MRFTIDHDLHIHSQLSLCSGDPGQNTAAIFAYGVKNGLKTLCLTDHMWDPAVPGASGWYAAQSYERTKTALPLPQSESVRFLFMVRWGKKFTEKHSKHFEFTSEHV